MAPSTTIFRLLRRLLPTGATALALSLVPPSTAAFGSSPVRPRVVVGMSGQASPSSPPRRPRVDEHPPPIAHAAGFPTAAPGPVVVTVPGPTVPPFIPNDPARQGPAGWQQLQWNFAGPFGVHAPEAWGNLIAAGRPGGRGVIVAVLDTGVAYADRGRFRRSPDFAAAQFVRGYDFVVKTPFPNDDNGHGTQVAGTIAEETNNGIGVTGLAYGVRIMPVRVLDGLGDGDASVIARGVRFAVLHHAQIINLSLEFTSDVTARAVPELAAALRLAHARGVLVVSAAGNEGTARIAYPARAPYVVAVGASTEHGCPADFSNHGTGLDILAPGGGADARLATLAEDPTCTPDTPGQPDIFQETLIDGSPRRFGLPAGYEGTSMAVPHVSAAAALVIASGVLGPHPTPDAIVARLKATARPLGPSPDPALFGAGLLDAGAATRPGGPGAVTAPARGNPPTGVTSSSTSIST